MYIMFHGSMSGLRGKRTITQVKRNPTMDIGKLLFLFSSSSDQLVPKRLHSSLPALKDFQKLSTFPEHKCRHEFIACKVIGNISI